MPPLHPRRPSSGNRDDRSKPLAIYHWYPLIAGRMLDERLGKLPFWVTFLGAYSIFLPLHYPCSASEADYTTLTRDAFCAARS